MMTFSVEDHSIRTGCKLHNSMDVFRARISLCPRAASPWPSSLCWSLCWRKRTRGLRAR